MLRALSQDPRESDPVVVLGMHRSGTSFLIRALNLAGLWLGDHAHLATIEGRAMSGNPKGNYEHREAIAINDALLKRSGGAWFNPPLQILGGAADEERMRAFCATLQATRPDDHPRCGWKDPRTVLTLDFWRRALPLCAVAAFRHPTAVARSLQARDKVPLAAGYALWAHYNRLLLRHLDRLPHALVRFDVAAPELIGRTQQVCEAIGLRTDPGVIASWHDAALVRSTADGAELARAPEVAKLWNELLERYRAQVPA